MVCLYSTIKMMHGPINIRSIIIICWFERTCAALRHWQFVAKSSTIHTKFWLWYIATKKKKIHVTNTAFSHSGRYIHTSAVVMLLCHAAHKITCKVTGCLHLRRNSPVWGTASSLSRVHDHTTLGRNPLYEWLACRRDLYLTAHNTHNRQTSILNLNSSKWVVAGLHLRQCGHWDRLGYFLMMSNYPNVTCNFQIIIKIKPLN